MTTPSTLDLWNRALLLIREAGPAYARKLEASKSHERYPVAYVSFQRGFLGDRVPAEPIVAALRDRLDLMAPDDGSRAWQDQLIQFFMRVRDVVEPLGTAALDGRHHSMRASQASDATLEDALRQRDARQLKLYRMVRDAPDKVALSLQTHFKQDPVQWHNALIYLAGQAPTPEAGQLMILVGDLARQGKMDTVFNAQDQAAIVRLSPMTFLQKSHAGSRTLRLAAAARLGELLDDPARRPDVLAALAQIQTSAQVPEARSPQDPQRAAEAQDRLQSQLDATLEQLQQHVEISAFAQAFAVRLADRDFSALTAQDWALVDRWVYPAQAQAPEELAQVAMDLLVYRWEQRLEQQCAGDILEPLAAPEDPARPRPRMG